MGIKSKSKPLQFKNVNISFSNKELLQKNSKAIKILAKNKVKPITFQDKYDTSNSKVVNFGYEDQMIIDEDYYISSSMLIDDDDDDGRLSVNSISLLDEGNEKEERNMDINILGLQCNLLDLEKKYVTKIPQYISKKSIDYFSLSILQETTVETENNNKSSRFISTPIQNGSRYRNRSGYAINKNSLDTFSLDDIDKSMFWDIFNSSQIDNYPRILPPPLTTSNKYGNPDDANMMITECDSSLNEFYHSYEHIPKKHFNIHSPLKILYPVSPLLLPLSSSSWSSSFSPASS